MERFFKRKSVRMPGSSSLGLVFSFSSSPSEVSLHEWIQNNAPRQLVFLNIMEYVNVGEVKARGSEDATFVTLFEMYTFMNKICKDTNLKVKIYKIAEMHVNGYFSMVTVLQGCTTNKRSFIRNTERGWTSV